MTTWTVLCNGGPNGKVVGTTKDSLGKACGQLESMMKVLSATKGMITRGDEFQTVLTEEEGADDLTLEEDAE